MKALELRFMLTLDEESTGSLVDMLRQVLQPVGQYDPHREARLRASQNALFAGQKPPDDRGLLIDTNQAAKLLKVSARTVWRMEHSGEMPKGMRIGRAVRWGYDELKQWVDEGCPSADEWKKLWQKRINK